MLSMFASRSTGSEGSVQRQVVKRPASALYVVFPVFSSVLPRTVKPTWPESSEASVARAWSVFRSTVANSAVSVSPVLNLVVVPARHAYSHLASVGSR